VKIRAVYWHSSDPAGHTVPRYRTEVQVNDVAVFLAQLLAIEVPR
jgi:hypothetical protein